MYACCVWSLARDCYKHDSACTRTNVREEFDYIEGTVNMQWMLLYKRIENGDWQIAGGYAEKEHAELMLKQIGKEAPAFMFPTEAIVHFMDEISLVSEVLVCENGETRRVDFYENT